MKEAFDPYGRLYSHVPQFSYTLDGNRTAQNDLSGTARFDNVQVGTHVVSEAPVFGWNLFAVTPQNGAVTVSPGPQCSVVNFKNVQVLASSSSNSSSSPIAVVIPPTMPVNPFVFQVDMPINVVNNNDVNAYANSNANANANPVVNVQANPVAGSNAGTYVAQAYKGDTKATQYVVFLPATGSSFTGALSGMHGMLLPIAGESPIGALSMIVSMLGLGTGSVIGRRRFGF